MGAHSALAALGSGNKKAKKVVVEHPNTSKVKKNYTKFYYSFIFYVFFFPEWNIRVQSINVICKVLIFG